MMDLKVERYTVYGGEFAHEPAGGMRDRMRGFDVEAEAIAFCQGYAAGRGSGCWVRVYDNALCKEVWTDAQL